MRHATIIRMHISWKDWVSVECPHCEVRMGYPIKALVKKQEKSGPVWTCSRCDEDFYVSWQRTSALQAGEE